MTTTLLAISAAYVVLPAAAVAGLSSRYAWWVKATAIVVTSLFFVEVFFASKGLLGWPRAGQLPAKFQLLWARVVEPDLKLANPGAIYLWVEEVDENNVPGGVPRSYRLPYSLPLADRTPRRAMRSWPASRRRVWPTISAAPKSSRRPNRMTSAPEVASIPADHGRPGSFRRCSRRSGWSSAPCRCRHCRRSRKSRWDRRTSSASLCRRAAARHRQKRFLDAWRSRRTRRVRPASCPPAPCRDAAR